MSMSFSLIYICCCFRGGILSVVFPTVALCFWPAGNLECPCSFPTLSSSLFSFFSSILFLTLPFLLCLFHWSRSAVVSGGHSICCFPTVAICFWPAGNLECPSLFRPYPLPFSPPFLYIVPYPSFSMSFSLIIYICCSFRGGILSVVFPAVLVAICSARREPGVPLSLFRSYPLPFSPPFLLYCSLPFLFFYVFFIDLYLL